MSRTDYQIAWRRLAALLCVMSAGAILISCGGGSKTEPTPSQAGSTQVPAGSGPGTITISSTTIQGQSGRIMLVFVSQEGQGQLARACIQLNSDSFMVPDTAMSDVPAGSDPCGGSTSVTTLPEGQYVLDVGIYAPPAQTPEKQLTQTVEVKGDVKVILDGKALSR